MCSGGDNCWDSQQKEPAPQKLDRIIIIIIIIFSGRVEITVGKKVKMLKKTEGC